MKKGKRSPEDPADFAVGTNSIVRSLYNRERKKRHQASTTKAELEKERRISDPCMTRSRPFWKKKNR